MPSRAKILNASEADVDALHRIETLAFGEGKAAGRDAFLYRLANYPEWFLKAQDGGTLAGFINGCPSDQAYITDDLYHAGSPFNPDGKNILIFGLAVHPDFRRRGIAHELMERMLFEAKKSGKTRAALTCKESLIPFYEGFGFKNRGISESVIGGIQFFNMEILL